MVALGEQVGSLAETGDVHDWLTVKGLAAALDVNAWTVYRWLREGRVHGVRIGGRWRFPRGTVQEIIGNGDQ